MQDSRVIARKLHQDCGIESRFASARDLKSKGEGIATTAPETRATVPEIAATAPETHRTAPEINRSVPEIDRTAPETNQTAPEIEIPHRTSA